MVVYESGSRGLLDTSVFIAREQNRPRGSLPDSTAISVVTIAELHLGVLMADDPDVRARRLQTLSVVQQTYQPLSIDEGVARVFAAIVAEARRLGRRPRAMDAWIAATAVAHHLPVYSQDVDFQSIPQVEVVLI
jgi:predicted nucleic acid-binding protein